jgi:hypothetical protein
MIAAAWSAERGAVEERDERGRVERVDARWWRNARAAAARSARREVRGGDARRRRAHVEVAFGEVAARDDGAVVSSVRSRERFGNRPRPRLEVRALSLARTETEP